MIPSPPFSDRRISFTTEDNHLQRSAHPQDSGTTSSNTSSSSIYNQSHSRFTPPSAALASDGREPNHNDIAAGSRACVLHPPAHATSRLSPWLTSDFSLRSCSQPGGRYRIQVRQQPAAARACGFGERDRRVIDPPPIVQLIVNDPPSPGGLSNNYTPDAELRYPFNVVHCTLWNVDGNTDETALTGADKRITRRLMGTLVSSPFVGQDEEGNEGCFFCFPDLSCRTHGKYRLRFVLMRLEPSDLQPEGYTPIITEALSDVFTVFTAKEFPGMRPSTALTRALKRQGCAISVKKGNEKAITGAGGGGDGSGKEDGSGDDESPGAKSKKRRTT